MTRKGLNIAIAVFFCGLLSLVRPAGFLLSAEAPGHREHPRAFLGISLVDFTDEYAGNFGAIHSVAGGVVRISAILPGTAAFRSALRQGDLLTGINGQPLPRHDPVQGVIEAIGRLTPEDTVTLSGFRLTCRLAQDGMAVGAHELREPLWAVLSRPGKWQATTIAKQVDVQPFEHRVRLGNRVVAAEGRALPGVEKLLPLGADEIVQAVPAGASEFIDNAEKVARVIAVDAYADLPGVTAVESTLHRHPLASKAMAERIGTAVAAPDYQGLLLSMADYVGAAGPHEPVFPPLPLTREEAIGQLVQFVIRKRALEAGFVTAGKEASRIRNLLEQLFAAYRGGQGGDPDYAGGIDLRAESLVLEEALDQGKIIEAGWFLRGFFSDARLRSLDELLGKEGGETLVRDGVVIRLGGTGDDHFAGQADLLIDFGGQDAYLQFDPGQQVPVIIDYSGDDLYQSAIPFGPGAGFLEASLLLDLAGNDTYVADHAAFGIGAGGIGIVVDLAGDDLYTANHTAMGVGLFGIGLLLDQQGNDRYLSGYRSQGVGLAGGVGLLRDDGGNDAYISRGARPSSYQEDGLFDGFSQGVGLGLRGLCRGGVGILADLAGSDSYNSGNFSQGAGYFFGTGILIDYGGNDAYRVARYGIGAAAHSASGLFMDLVGDDLYRADVQAICGAAWDLSVALFADSSGDDRYDSEQHFSFGAADHNGLAWHYDAGGDDRYGRLFYTVQTNSYHGGHSAGLLFNKGGKDAYPAGYGDGLTRQEGEFLFIDTAAATAAGRD